MIPESPERQDLTSYSRFVLYGLVLPLLFIAGVQLFLLSEQTETYFAWTFAAPISAAFLGAGYWAAMIHAYTGARSRAWSFVRTSLPPALTATGLLSITTFLHIDKFHLASPLLLTRFVTWVWILVYIFVPPILAIAWIVQSRQPGAHARGNDPLPAWMRAGFGLLAVIALFSGLGLFLVPERMAALWPWAVTPLPARAVSSWLSAFGVACAALVLENDIRNGAGTSSSLCAFCTLELVVIARFASALDWGKPMSIAYVLFLVLGVIVTGANVVMNRTPPAPLGHPPQMRHR
jgi:hypothetical protein